MNDSNPYARYHRRQGGRDELDVLEAYMVDGNPDDVQEIWHNWDE